MSIFIITEIIKWKSESQRIFPKYYTSLELAKNAVNSHCSKKCPCNYETGKYSQPRPELCDFHKPWVKWDKNVLIYTDDDVSMKYIVSEIKCGDSENNLK